MNPVPSQAHVHPDLRRVYGHCRHLDAQSQRVLRARRTPRPSESDHRADPGEHTASPFNIAGLATIHYTASPSGMVESQRRSDRICKARSPTRMRRTASSTRRCRSCGCSARSSRSRNTRTYYRFARFPTTGPERRRVGFVTGDRRDIDVARIWVNSENTNMQMDSFYGKSTSATIRYLGAENDAIRAVRATRLARRCAQQWAAGFRWTARP